MGACANFVRTMAVAREASDANLSTEARTPAAEGARTAKKAGDRRRRKNKGGPVECESKTEKAIQDGRKWAQKVFEEGDRTVEVFLLVWLLELIDKNFCLPQDFFTFSWYPLTTVFGVGRFDEQQF